MMPYLILDFCVFNDFFSFFYCLFNLVIKIFLYANSFLNNFLLNTMFLNIYFLIMWLECLMHINSNFFIFQLTDTHITFS